MQVNKFGRELRPEQSQECLDMLAEVFGIKGKVTDFIGSHPVALSHESIQALVDKDYLVCEKTDGIRLMMLVFNGLIYFYDRKNKLYLTDLVFNTPCSFLFDGELYLEERKYIYSMFDTLLYDSKPRIALNLNKRLWYCFEFEKIVRRGFIKRRNDSSLESFRIIAKDMFKSYAFVDILNGIKDLKHENDGLIFTPVSEPYVLNSRSKILKWKPPHLNTVDFLIKATPDPGIYSLYCTAASHQIYTVERLRSHDTIIWFDIFYAGEKDHLMGTELDGKIGEFVFNEDKEVLDLADLTITRGGWDLHRIRTDKNAANNVKIVLDTLDSVENSLSLEDLKSYQKVIMENFKKRSEVIK